MASDPPQTTSATPPPSSSATTATVTNPPTTKLTSPIPQPHQNQNQNLSLRSPNPSATPPQALLYPVASSGRGFVPISIRPQTSVHVANAGKYPPLSYAKAMRPPHAHYLHPAPTGSATIKGFPSSSHQKVASSLVSAPDRNGYRNMRDDSIAVVRDRKVRVSAGSSLYEMCRSWLKNGFHEETQPQYMDGVNSLPRPLPIPMADANLTKRNEEEEEEENEESTEHLSAQDLLKKHIKHAKRLRSRLREERLQRIARYKTRLALLLPPPVEQFRNDSAAVK